MRVLVNGLRLPRTAVGAGIAAVAGLAAVAGIAVGASVLGPLAAEFPIPSRRVVVVATNLLALAAFLIPLVVAREELLDPRALRTFGLGRSRVATALLVATLVGPGAAIVVLAVLPVLTWSGAGRGATLAVLPLVVLQGVLSARLGVALGARLRHHPVWSLLVRLAVIVVLGLGVLVIVAHIAPWLGALAPATSWSGALGFVLALAPLRDPAIADALATLPFGALARVPLEAETGDAGAVLVAVASGLLLIAVLAAFWTLVVVIGFRATSRRARAREVRAPGWFRHLPSGATGAVAARSLDYWRRDPRYRVVLVTLPVVAGGILVAMWLAGVPMSAAALMPLPVVLLLVSWASLHNDIALDSTAVWLHVAAQIRGVADRAGRVVPVLALGAIIMLLGVPLTVWGFGDPFVTPAVVGVSLAILLGGAGVSSVFSARFPYPTTRPHDPPFQQPQVLGTDGAAAQFASVLAILVIASPAFTASGLWLAGVPGPWNWIALVVGAVAGAGALSAGIRAGGAIFDRRSPELLAFTMRN